MNKKIVLTTMIILALMISLCSCRSNDKKINRVSGINSYRHKSLELADDPSFTNRILSVEKINGSDFALELCYRFTGEDNIEKYLVLYRFDDEGNIDKRTRIDADVGIQCEVASISDKGLLIQLLNGSLALIDMDTGDITKISDGGDSSLVIGLCAIPDGYIVVREGSISKLDNELQEISGINDYIISQYSISPFFVENDKYFLELPDGFYNVDFGRGSIDKVIDYSDLPVISPEPYGKYLVGDSGLFEIDMESLTLKTLADFNYVNVRPSSRDAEERYFCLDDTHFIKSYSYLNGGAEIDLYTYDSTLDYSSAQKIVIGGYGVGKDMSLKQAVYQFNSTHSEYRIILDDYSLEYSWDNSEDAQAALLKLIKRFNEGNAPDIFYGENFDYEYFGKTGIVCDLMPYLDGNDITSKLYPSVARTMAGKGKCFSVFSSFQLDGYWGLKSVFDNKDCSFEDLEQKAEQTGLPPETTTFAYVISDNMIRYPFGMYVSDVSGDHVIDKESLKKIIEYSVRYGVGSEEDMVDYAPKSMTEGEVLTQRSFVSDIYDYYYCSMSPDSSEHRPLVYLGFPAVNGSVHGIRAAGLCAISDSSKYKDICWEFISYLLSDEVQKYAVSQGMIPVRRDMIDCMLDYSCDPSSIPDSELVIKERILSVSDGKALTKDVADEYRNALDKIDTVISYDWGIFNIVKEEIMSYYIQNKSFDSIADSMQSRLDLYAKENY